MTKEPSCQPAQAAPTRERPVAEDATPSFGRGECHAVGETEC